MKVSGQRYGRVPTTPNPSDGLKPHCAELAKFCPPESYPLPPTRKDKMPTKILVCEKRCKHPYQDEKYGAGKRVHNPMKAGSGKVRCSVCTNIVIVEKEVIPSPTIA